MLRPHYWQVAKIGNSELGRVGIAENLIALYDVASLAKAVNAACSKCILAPHLRYDWCHCTISIRCDLPLAIDSVAAFVPFVFLAISTIAVACLLMTFNNSSCRSWTLPRVSSRASLDFSSLVSD